MTRDELRDFIEWELLPYAGHSEPGIVRESCERLMVEIDRYVAEARRQTAEECCKLVEAWHPGDDWPQLGTRIDTIVSSIRAKFGLDKKEGEK